MTNPGTNDTRLPDFMKAVRELGKDAAEGKDSLPKLAFKVVEAAANGVISFTEGRATIQSFKGETGGGQIELSGTIDRSVFRLHAIAREVRVRYPIADERLLTVMAWVRSKESDVGTDSVQTCQRLTDASIIDVTLAVDGEEVVTKRLACRA